MSTLGYYGSQDLLADGVEDLALVVLAEQLVDVGEFLGDWLLEYPEGNGYGLQIFGTSCHVDVDGLESGIIDDR